ncbi:putative quinol monooxygenase [Curvivirga sp.]|uniref:putative quinol monooxygenase n=1 Tax=Curvivirga sp. TaxID=2856848 RepID=UPI003B598B71
MPVTVTIHAEVKSDIYQDLQIFLEENLPNVRGFKGALNVSVFFNSETNNFLIHEEWLSKADHQEYLKFITENGVMAQLASFFIDTPAINYYSKAAL